MQISCGCASHSAKAKACTCAFTQGSFEDGVMLAACAVFLLLVVPVLA